MYYLLCILFVFLSRFPEYLSGDSCPPTRLKVACVRTVHKAENWFILFSIHDSLSNPLQRGGGESTAARGADQPSPPSSPPRTPGSRGRGRGRGQAGVSVRTGGGSRTFAVAGKGPHYFFIKAPNSAFTLEKDTIICLTGD